MTIKIFLKRAWTDGKTTLDNLKIESFEVDEENNVRIIVSD